MADHRWTALISILALFLYFGMALRVGAARRASGIAPPAMTGDPLLERAVRVHLNTLEWLPLFLAGLWLFAIYVDERGAAITGAVWIVGRLAYAIGYLSDPRKRSLGFFVQLLAVAVLLLGAFGRIAFSLATGAR